MMNFSMNGKRRVPVGVPKRVQVVQPQKLVQRQVVVAPVVPVVPVVLHESNENGENVNNINENVIIYTIGHEDINIQEPVLEEPVIETLSKPMEVIVEEKVEDKVEAYVNTRVDNNKKKNKKKNTKK